MVAMKVSIVIRVHNSAKTLGEVLWSINAQRFRDYEVVVVDSGSTDETESLVQNYRHKFVDFSKQKFTYGGALNAGCKSAEGEYIVCLSSHCVPAHVDWLGRIVEALDDGQVAAAWGPPILDESTRVGNQTSVEKIDLETFLLNPTRGLQNSNSIIRRDLWAEHPFSEELEGCEDQEWAHYFLQSGYDTAVVHGAPVFYRYPHGFFRFASKTYKNSLTLHRMFGYEGWRISFPALWGEGRWFLRAILQRKRTLRSSKLPMASRVGRWAAGRALDRRG